MHQRRPGEIEAGIIERLCAVARISGETVQPDRTFVSFSLDSMDAISLSLELEEWLGMPIRHELFWEYPTIRALARYLAEQQPMEGISAHVSEDVPAECWQLDHLPQYKTLHERLDILKLSGKPSPFFRELDGVAASRVLIGGREVINLATYNYLGLCGHPVVSEAAKQAIDRYGTSASASRVVSGERQVYHELEREIADLVGTADAIAFVGGHATNVTTIGHLFGPKDLIVHDALVHNSAVQGAMLSGARRLTFPHNDWQALDELLRARRRSFQKVLVIIEGVYSTEGDIPSLPRFIEVKRRHRAMLLVDEAHSIGVLGQHGRGLGEHFGVDPMDVDLWMGTLSKTFASCGGYIAGCHAAIEYLKYSAPGFVFSAGMAPANAAAATAAIRVMLSEPERLVRLRERSDFFRNQLRKRGLHHGVSQDTPVIPVVVGPPPVCMRLSQLLLDSGVNVAPLVAPAVDDNGARLRFFITSEHAEEHLEYAADILLEQLRKIGRAPQASQQRVPARAAPIARARTVPRGADKPHVGVVVPSYNRAGLLPATIDSVLAQDVATWQLVVVDDGSTDGTAELVRRYVSSEPRVALVRQSNRGLPAARNRGLAELSSSVELVLFLDSDDVLHPHALRRLMQALDDHPRAVAAHGLYRLIDDQGQPSRCKPLDAFRSRRRGIVDGQACDWPESAATNFAVMALGGSTIVTPGQVLMRRQALAAAGPWDPVLPALEDWDMWLRLTCLGEMVFLNDILIDIRRHESGMSNEQDTMLVLACYVMYRWACSDVTTRWQRSILAAAMNDIGAMMASWVRRRSLGDPPGENLAGTIMSTMQALADLARDHPTEERRAAVLDRLAGMVRMLSTLPGLTWSSIEEMQLEWWFGEDRQAPAIASGRLG